MSIFSLLNQLENDEIVLPAIQRDFVWPNERIYKLLDSIMWGYPIDIILLWETYEDIQYRTFIMDYKPGNLHSYHDNTQGKKLKLVLDGQQRITSLYGIICGRAPQFFDGNAQAFTGLHFHLDDEVFEFYAPMKMKGNPLWIDVTKLMQTGVGHAIGELHAVPEFRPNLDKYINRLTSIGNIKETDLHIEEVTGEDKTVDVVVDIFNIVNSGGTKLSKGDLALAKICTEWPEAREEMKVRLNKWSKFGFYFRLEWLLRNINAIITGEALFSALKDVDRATFEKGLWQAEKAIDYLINLISARLGLDHDRVLGSRYSFPVLASYVMRRGGHLSDYSERDKLLYWYVHTFLWGRYAGSTETVLNRDLGLIEEGDGTLESLINELRHNRGDLRINANDFGGWSLGARFYPVLYMLTRAWHARDWDTGIELSGHLLGSLSRLELHHIFPKAQLRKYGYPVAEVNAIANFTFLTKETNLKVSDRLPAEYLEGFAGKQPGAIESHWIPMDQRLWRIEYYREFLNARRELLAKATNDFLDSLFTGAVPETMVASSIVEQEKITVPGGVASDEEERTIHQCNDWVIQKGLPDGEYMYELADPDSGEPLAILDLAWPSGLQEGYSQPVVLLIDETPETMEAASRAGYRYFTDVDSFYKYVEREILGEVQSVL